MLIARRWTFAETCRRVAVAAMTNDQVNKTGIWVLRAAVTVALGAVIYWGQDIRASVGKLTAANNSHETRISIIEGNRFDAGKAQALTELVANTVTAQRDITMALGKLEVRLAALPTTYPPPWVLDDIGETKAGVDANGEKIDELKEMLLKHQIDHPKP